MTGRDEDFAFELDDEMLESIAGGELSPEIQLMVSQLINMYKQKGLTKEQLINAILLTHDEQLSADAVAYIEEMWDSTTI